MVARNIRKQVGQEPLQELEHDPAPVTLGRTSQGQWLEVSIEYEGKRMVFPINPSELSITRGANNHIYEVLELGEVALPNTPALDAVHFTSQFWRERDVNKSGAYVDWLNEWRKEEKPGRLVIANNNPESDYGGYNKLVICEGFDTNEGRAGFEDDVYYTLDLKEWREGVEVGEVDVEYDAMMEEPYILPPEPLRSDAVERAPLPRTHTVARGDTLYSIARLYGQPESAWREMYEVPANKQLLSRNPFMIKSPYRVAVGMVLTVPSAWVESSGPRTTPVPPPPRPPLAQSQPSFLASVRRVVGVGAANA